MFGFSSRYAWPVVIDVLKSCLNLEPRSEGQEPSTKVRGPRTLSRGSWTASRGSSFVAPASWTPNRGGLKLVKRSGSNWMEGGSLCLGVVEPWTKSYAITFGQMKRKLNKNVFFGFISKKNRPHHSL